MIATPHALFGAAVGVGSDRFLLAAVLSYCGHVALDALPSWEPILFGGPVHIALMVLDVAVAVTLLAVVIRWFGRRGAALAFWGAGFSLLPDVLMVASHLTGRDLPYPLGGLHKAVQYEHMPVLGTFSQLIVIGLSLWFLKRKQHCAAAKRTLTDQGNREITAL